MRKPANPLTPSTTSLRPRNFTDAVAAAATSLPAVARAEAHHAGRHCWVRYTLTSGGPEIELQALTSATAALAFFIRSATAQRLPRRRART